MFVKHLVCDTKDETFGTASLANNAPERRSHQRFGALSGSWPENKVRPGDDCVCLPPTDVLNGGDLRVRGERSEQDLRHVLLAQGHQEQRQALIG